MRELDRHGASISPAAAGRSQRGMRVCPAPRCRRSSAQNTDFIRITATTPLTNPRIRKAGKFGIERQIAGSWQGKLSHAAELQPVDDRACNRGDGDRREGVHGEVAQHHLQRKDRACDRGVEAGRNRRRHRAAQQIAPGHPLALMRADTQAEITAARCTTGPSRPEDPPVDSVISEAERRGQPCPLFHPPFVQAPRPRSRRPRRAPGRPA